jgi:hypothetical protein
MDIAALTASSTDPTTSGLGIGFTAIALIFVAYFLPAIVSATRRHHNHAAIVMLNFFLGWTLVDWVVAMVWAVTNPPPKAS